MVSAGHGRRKIMCMKMYLVDGMYLGNRLIGYEVYSPKGGLIR